MGYKLTWVYIRPNGTEQKIRPEWWQPWANTIAYYPLTSVTTTSDMKGSWTAYDLTNYNVSFTTYQWVDCWVFYGNTNYESWLYNQTAPARTSWNYTFLCWFYVGTDTMTYNTRVQWFYGYPCSVYNLGGYYWINNADAWSPRAQITNTSQWNLWTITWEWSAVKVYLNWSLEYTWTDSEYSNRFWGTHPWIVIWWSDNPWSSADKFSWWISEVIYENKVRTAQEIADYYNQTKANYWIS